MVVWYTVKFTHMPLRLAPEILYSIDMISLAGCNSKAHLVRHL